MREVVPMGRRIRFLGPVLAMLVCAAGCSAQSVTESGSQLQDKLVRYDGPALVVTGVTQHALFAIRPDGTGLRRLPVAASVTPYDAAWSPDGEQIAFAAERANDGSDLYLMRADGTGLRQLTHAPWGVNSVSWSPDGQWIAFIGWAGNDNVAFVVHPDGSGLHRILTSFSVRTLAWGPDGRLAISGAPGKNSWWRGGLGIWTVNPDGSDVKLVAGPIALPATADGVGIIATLPSVDGWSADGRSLLVIDAPRPGEVSLLPVAGGPARVILHCPLRTCVVEQGGMGANPYFQDNIDDAALSPGGTTVALIIGGGGDDDQGSLYEVGGNGDDLRPVAIPGGPGQLARVSWNASGSAGDAQRS
jgi:dipeptidyl aminopeptidase/acylaminoacyl peptidase